MVHCSTTWDSFSSSSFSRRSWHLPSLLAIISTDNLNTYLAEKKLWYSAKPIIQPSNFLIKHPKLRESCCRGRFLMLIKFKLNASSRPEVKGHGQEKQCQFFLPICRKGAFLTCWLCWSLVLYPLLHAMYVHGHTRIHTHTCTNTHLCLAAPIFLPLLICIVSDSIKSPSSRKCWCLELVGSSHWNKNTNFMLWEYHE